MSTPTDAYDRLIVSLRQIALLGSIGSLLDWDERTQLPPRGGAFRADQSALIARMVHEQFTSAKIGQMLDAVEGTSLVVDPVSDAAVNVRETRRSYDRAVKVPASLIEEITRTSVLAQQAWVDARSKADFSLFLPWLTRMLDLKKQEAQCIGYRTSAYDALLDGFEPGETSEHLTAVFASLRGPLVDLVSRIASSKRKAPVDILARHYPTESQQTLARMAAQAIGFDFQAGRLDSTVHPFCSGIGPGDTRLTTRYDEHDFANAFFGVLHETGHGLYDQGLDPQYFGTPRGEAISLGIHESQSRLWENLVGRGRSFWRFFFPRVREAFPAAMVGVTEEQWHFAVNAVQPSFIRTESDQTTYNLHVLLRFELEQALINGQMDAADLPAAWNAKMQQYLGITPADDAEGCLQDIHWSSGGFGYFPTYTLGNLYAAQFFEQAGADLVNLDAQLAAGNFTPLLQWLREKIHRHGKRYTGPQLVEIVTGKPLSAEPLLRHLRANAAELYGV